MDDQQERHLESEFWRQFYLTEGLMSAEDEEAEEERINLRKLLEAQQNENPYGIGDIVASMTVISVDENGDELPMCDFCMWPTTEPLHDSERFIGMGNLPQRAKLCDVCYSTYAGNAHHYPEQYPHREVMRLVAWQTNYLASLIKGASR